MDDIHSVKDEFKINDKVICIDDSPDYGPFGKLANTPLKKGSTYTVYAVDQYNVRGEVLQVSSDQHQCGWTKRHFKLVHRVKISE